MFPPEPESKKRIKQKPIRELSVDNWSPRPQQPDLTGKRLHVIILWPNLDVHVFIKSNSDSDTGEEETDEGFFVDVTEVQIKKNPAIRTLSVSGPPIRAQKHNHIHGKFIITYKINKFFTTSYYVTITSSKILRNSY